MSPTSRDPRILTREDFADTIADLKSDLREDLARISDHLADLNGRTRKGEIADAEVRLKVGYLEAQLEAQRLQLAMAPRPASAEAAPSVHVLSPKAQAALVGSSVLVLTALFKVVSVLASAIGGKVVDLVLKK
jgi:hypothetical protein